MVYDLNMISLGLVTLYHGVAPIVKDNTDIIYSAFGLGYWGESYPYIETEAWKE